jgi:hypothetical protein
MKKIIKYCIITAIIIFFAYFIISISLVLIEEYLEADNRNLFIYNFTNDDIDIKINNKKLKKINGKTFVSDNIFSDDDILNFKISINKIIIFDKGFKIGDIVRSTSARGGGDIQIEIYKLDIENYEVKISKPVDKINADYYEKPKNSDELKSEYRKNIKYFFDSDGLN